jgi:hypothetical protein
LDQWSFGKSIYPSVELCADAVLANSTNCGAGLGYFIYHETEKLCRCCNDAKAYDDRIPSTSGNDLYKLSTDHGTFGKFAYNYTK